MLFGISNLPAACEGMTVQQRTKGGKEGEGEKKNDREGSEAPTHGAEPVKLNTL